MHGGTLLYKRKKTNIKANARKNDKWITKTKKKLLTEDKG